MARDKLLTKVRVSDEEKARIENNAESCSMTVSAFMRNLALGYEPKSTLDCKDVLALAKISGDQGRLGGLLKMLLTNDEKVTEANISVINNLLGQIELTQELLLQKVEQL